MHTERRTGQKIKNVYKITELQLQVCVCVRPCVCVFVRKFIIIQDKQGSKLYPAQNILSSASSKQYFAAEICIFCLILILFYF